MAGPKLIEVLPGKWVNPLYVTCVEVNHPTDSTYMNINTVGGGVYLSGDNQKGNIETALKALGLEPPKEQETN